MSSAERPVDEEGGAPATRCLDARVIWLWRATLLAETAGVGLGTLLLGRWIELPASAAVLAGAVAALGLVLAVLWPPAEYRAWGFRLRSRDLLVHRGVLSLTTSVIPHRRIQHVDTRRDLLERWLGLARVVVYTAGIRGAQVTIPGLPADEAEALRDQLAELGGADEGI